MAGFIAVVLMVIGWAATVTSTFIWVGYSIYQVIKTDLGFFEIVLPNAGFWLLQLVAGVICITLPTAFRK